MYIYIYIFGIFGHIWSHICILLLFCICLDSYLINQSKFIEQCLLIFLLLHTLAIFLVFLDEQNEAKNHANHIFCFVSINRHIKNNKMMPYHASDTPIFLSKAFLSDICIRCPGSETQFLPIRLC